MYAHYVLRCGELRTQTCARACQFLCSFLSYELYLQDSSYSVFAPYQCLCCFLIMSCTYTYVVFFTLKLKHKFCRLTFTLDMYTYINTNAPTQCLMYMWQWGKICMHAYMELLVKSMNEWSQFQPFMDSWV